MTKQTKSVSAKENQNFEKNVKRLEEIVHKVETEDLNLHSSLKYFEEGMTLVKSCEDELQQISGKIEKIIKSSDGKESIVNIDEKEFS